MLLEGEQINILSCVQFFVKLMHYGQRLNKMNYNLDKFNVVQYIANGFTYCTIIFVRRLEFRNLIIF